MMIRRLTVADAAAYRDLRLAALAAHPAAFTAAFEDEVDKPLSDFAERLSTGTVFAGESDTDGRLQGMAGFYVRQGLKVCHRGMLWGMYVRPEARGTGLAAALIEAVKAHARPLVEEIMLGVGTDNPAAIARYRAAGFVRCGGERRSIKIGDRYHDEILMAFRFPRRR
jgi:ribosomal protein S18 acetylase RimI-like enzyme